MRRRRRYGQHFLVSGSVASRIAAMAGICRDDSVLEVGTGRGMLTPLLCSSARRVVSVESDSLLYGEAAARLRQDNLTLLHGDGFAHADAFDVFVSNLPYSQSRRAVEWLATVPFRCGVVMVQEEFFQKAAGTGPGRRAISVVWQEAFDVHDTFRVGPRNFEPSPQVNSVVVGFGKRRTIPRDTIRRLHLIFSRRRKVLHTDRGARRLDELTNGEVMEIAASV